MIRPAEPADTPTLVALSASTGVFKPYELQVLDELLTEFHAGNLGEDHTAIVLQHETTIVGYAYYAPDVMTDQTWYLYWIAVHAAQHGQGYGRELMGSVEEDIRGREGRLILIETSSLPHSERTRGFYQKQGYELCARIADFYSDGDDMVVFRKRLRAAKPPAKKHP
jgi:ribosomal protein S18 acetylase RimI-like enzyme